MSTNAHKVPAAGAAGASSTADADAATAAFRELEQLVRHLGEELTGFRRRALQAENRLKAAEAEVADAVAVARATAGDAPHPRVAELERENEQLRRRLDEAAARTRQMIDRVRFLRQQHQFGPLADK